MNMSRKTIEVYVKEENRPILEQIRKVFPERSTSESIFKALRFALEKAGQMPRDEFARHIGYADWSRLMEASEHVVSEGDVDWWITRLPDGRWAAWDDKELAADRVERFDTREEAIRFHRGGFEAAELPSECWLLD